MHSRASVSGVSVGRLFLSIEAVRSYESRYKAAVTSDTRAKNDFSFFDMSRRTPAGGDKEVVP